MHFYPVKKKINSKVHCKLGIEYINVGLIHLAIDQLLYNTHVPSYF